MINNFSINIRRTMRTIILLNFILLTILSCKNEQGIQKETQNRILFHKNFIRQIYFEGIVSDKIYCNECHLNKYQVKVKVSTMRPEKIELGNLSFQPYYSILEEKEITLSVNKKLYDATDKGIKIIKKTNSNNLSIKNKDYKLISEKKYKWIP